MVDYTLVIGVDANHLKQLAMVWPTWIRHKPSLCFWPMVVFHDDSVTEAKIRACLRSANQHQVRTYSWPPPGINYSGDGLSKFSNPQRHKMLAGFVHVPALVVDTEYWRKLDTDVVATGVDDWIDEQWFIEKPAIVAQPWSFTKPADQMLKLDQWIKDTPWLDYDVFSAATEPLNLQPEPGAERVGHKRIISWCGFFSTQHSIQCSDMANHTVGPCQIPVPSQDGYMWYVAKRLGHPIVRPQMKSRGWEHWTTTQNIAKAVERSLHGK